jgi:hypothetical protein
MDKLLEWPSGRNRQKQLYAPKIVKNIKWPLGFLLKSPKCLAITRCFFYVLKITKFVEQSLGVFCMFQKNVENA